MAIIVPSALIPALLRVTRANRNWSTEAGAIAHAQEARLRPAPYGPPTRLRRDVRVEVERESGWPVYTVTPRDGTPRGAVVYVHGGGWVDDIDPAHWALVGQIAAEAKTAVVVPIYPLIPFGNARGVRDGVVRLVLGTMEQYGPTALAGDSAGGQIALSSALALRDDHEVTLPLTVLISPALDLAFSNPEIPRVQPTDPWLGAAGVRVYAEQWRGNDSVDDPAVSPLHGSLAGLGPLRLFTGTRDILNPDAHELRRKAEHAGVTLEFHERSGQVHVYPLAPTSVGRTTRTLIATAIGNALQTSS